MMIIKVLLGKSVSLVQNFKEKGSPRTSVYLCLYGESSVKISIQTRLAT